MRRIETAPLLTAALAKAGLRSARALAPAGARIEVGHVLGVEADGRPRLALPGGGLVTAEWALPYRYAPAPGDALLVIGRGGRAWVLGVVQGRGRTELAFRGDARLGARGRLRLRADRALRLVGERVTLRARRLEVAARTVQEKATHVVRTVTGLLEERAGESRRVVDEEDALFAGTVTRLAADALTIDCNEAILLQ